MSTARLHRISGIAIILAAIIQAVVVTLELIASPYNQYGTELWLNAPIHLATYVSGVVLLLALPAVYLYQRQRAGRLGFVGFYGLAFGFGLVAMPYTVLEFTMDPTLTQQQAADFLARAEEMNMAIPLLGMAGFLTFVLGLIAAGIATLRARVLSRWVPWLSLASLPMGMLVSGVGQHFLPGKVPHDPVWIMLGLLGYGYALARQPHAVVEEQSHRIPSVTMGAPSPVLER